MGLSQKLGKALGLEDIRARGGNEEKVAEGVGLQGRCRVKRRQRHDVHHYGRYDVARNTRHGVKLHRIYRAQRDTR